MIFPSIEEYKDALRIAGHSLKTLQGYEPVLRDDGELWFSSGNFAVVFKMRHRSSGRLLALKCFTRHQENRAESYRLITECLKDYPSDYLVRYEYCDEELWVNSRAAGDRDFPVLAMDWAEGVTLGEYVRNCCAHNDREALQCLIEEFNWFAFWLLSQPFAHGDLKPDNIVVRPDGKPVLLDYDGMYVPSMKGQKARELGSPVYRHPACTVDSFDKRIDDFALLVLLLELRILATDPAKHAGRGVGESLCFRPADVAAPAGWSNELGNFPATRLLLHHFEQTLAGEGTDVGALLFGIVKGESLPEPVESPRVAILTKRFDWEPEMVLVKGGTFLMGSDRSVATRPVHEVTLEDFYIGKYPITQAQWQSVMGTNPSHFKGCDDCPVESVSWSDTQIFIEKLNEVTRKKYHLPSEAEWEYAARGGCKSKGFKYSGSNNLDEVGWYRKNSENKTHIVGGKLANEIGLYDMSGNVWEWVEDDYHFNYAGAPSDGSAWIATNRGFAHILRGGSWKNHDECFCESCFRVRNFPNDLASLVGFRLAQCNL